MARIHRRLAWQDWFTGQDAEPALRHSLSILSNLAEQFPGDPSLREELSRAHAFLSAWLRADLRFEEAVQQRRISLGIIRDLVAEFPSNEEYRQSADIVGTINGTASGWNWQFRRGGEVLSRSPHGRRPARTASSGSRSECIMPILLVRFARYEEADQVLEEALQIAERGAALPTRRPPARMGAQRTSSLRAAITGLGLWIFISGPIRRGRTTSAPSDRPDQRPLSDDYPPLVWLPLPVELWHHDLAEVLTAMGRMEEAEEARRQSLAAWESVDTASRRQVSLRQRSGALPLGRASPRHGSHGGGPAAVRPGASHHGRTRHAPAE